MSESSLVFTLNHRPGAYNSHPRDLCNPLYPSELSVRHDGSLFQHFGQVWGEASSVTLTLPVSHAHKWPQHPTPMNRHPPHCSSVPCSCEAAAAACCG